MDLTILIADDHPLIRIGMHAQLTQLGFRRILEAWDQTSLQRTVATHPQIGLILLDVVMPGHDGADWPVFFCERHSHLPVLLISGLSEGDVRARFARCVNVRGMIAKARPARDLRSSIDRAVAGVSQWQEAADCALPIGTSVATRYGELTRKQAEVASLVCMGLTNREVAQELAMQEGTVKNHLKEVFARLGVTNRTQLALRLPLIS